MPGAGGRPVAEELVERQALLLIGPRAPGPALEDRLRRGQPGQTRLDAVAAEQALAAPGARLVEVPEAALVYEPARLQAAHGVEKVLPGLRRHRPPFGHGLAQLLSESFPDRLQ